MEQMKTNPFSGSYAQVAGKEKFKKICEAWKTMPESDKDEYRKRSGVLSEEYRKALIAWEMRMLEEGHADLVRSQTREKIEKEEKKNLTNN